MRWSGSDEVPTKTTSSTCGYISENTRKIIDTGVIRLKVFVHRDGCCIYSEQRMSWFYGTFPVRCQRLGKYRRRGYIALSIVVFTTADHALYALNDMFCENEHVPSESREI